MLFISLRDFPYPYPHRLFFCALAKVHTRGHTLTHRSLEGSRKSIREPSPFTFISHLFLIPPPFWSFLFPLALPQLLFYQLRERVKYIPNQSANAFWWSLKDFTSAVLPVRSAQVVHACVFVHVCVFVCTCARHVRLTRSPCLSPCLALANTAGCFIIIKKCSAAPFLWRVSQCIEHHPAYMCACKCVRARPSDCSRFICLLNETRISPYSLENPAEFSLHQGPASVSTPNGNPPKNVCVWHV